MKLWHWHWVSIGHYEAVAVGNQLYWVSRGGLCLYILNKERRNIYYLFKFLHIKLVHSIPSNSGGRKSASGRRLEIIAALPRIRWRDIFWISWPIISLSSEPVCLASAEPKTNDPPPIHCLAMPIGPLLSLVWERISPRESVWPTLSLPSLSFLPPLTHNHSSLSSAT